MLLRINNIAERLEGLGEGLSGLFEQERTKGEMNVILVLWRKRKGFESWKTYRGSVVLALAIGEGW